MWVVALCSLLLTGAATSTPDTVDDSVATRDYCIIGAGPGGVQLGYFLEQRGRDYVIFERSPRAADFFSHYPRHGNLISINKRYTPSFQQHPDFRMRHDWNSLLSTQDNVSSSDVQCHERSLRNPKLLFGNWSDDYYPQAGDLVKYVNYFANHFGLNIHYNRRVEAVLRYTTVQSVPEAAKFQLQVRNLEPHDSSSQNEADLASVDCRRVVVATGLSATFSPQNMRNVDRNGNAVVLGYEDVPLEADFFRDKEVMILGKGNAAFELANSISAYSTATTILSRSELRLSYVSS